MKKYKPIIILILILVSISTIIAGITITILYNTSFQQQQERLIEIVNSQANLIEAVAKFDSIYSHNYPRGTIAATISQIVDAHKHHKGFSKTGQFILAKREGDKIIFILVHKHNDYDKPKPVPFKSNIADPMRKALLGQSGQGIFLDYRGVKVLSAYTPVKKLNLGIVAKIDLSEIRAPFIKAGLISGLLAFILVIIGVILIYRIVNPMTIKLQESEELKKAHNKLINQEKQTVLGSLAAGLIHEIRNHLNPIGFLELIKDKLSKEEKEDIQHILNARNRIVGLIDEISSLAGGRESDYSLTTQDLKKLIDESIFIAKMDIDIMHKEIITDFQFTGQVLMNKDKILQVLLNLIRNAAQSIEGIKNGQIIVKTERDKKIVLVHVIDNGFGIEKSILADIWKPFFTTKSEQGMGIGLDICKHIIENHNGTISCSSKINKGAIFTFSLQLK